MFRQISRLGLALILATLAFSLWGYIWYATLFDDVWQNLISRSEQELIDMATARGHWNDVYVLLVSFVQALGIMIGLSLARARTVFGYIGIGIGLATFIALPALGNATIFAGTPFMLLLTNINL